MSETMSSAVIDERGVQQQQEEDADEASGDESAAD